MTGVTKRGEARAGGGALSGGVLLSRQPAQWRAAAMPSVGRRVGGAVPDRTASPAEGKSRGGGTENGQDAGHSSLPGALIPPQFRPSSSRHKSGCPNSDLSANGYGVARMAVGRDQHHSRRLFQRCRQLAELGRKDDQVRTMLADRAHQFRAGGDAGRQLCLRGQPQQFGLASASPMVVSTQSSPGEAMRSTMVRP